MKRLTILLVVISINYSIAQELPCQKKYVNQVCALRYKVNSQGQIHGKFIEYSEGGKVIRQGTYINGTKTGSWYDSSDGALLFFGGIYQWYDSKGNFIVGSNQIISSLEAANKLKSQKDEANKRTEVITIEGTQYKAEYQLNSWGNCYVGAYKLFYMSGKPYKVSTFKECQETGQYYMYYESGKLKEKGQYAYNKKNGVVEAYYEDGKLRFKANFKAGKEDGLWEQYWPSGKLKLRYNYVEGKLNGNSEDYYEDGTLKYKMNYKDDLQDGIQANYSKTGKVERTEKISYEMGWSTPLKKIVYIEEYYPNGKIQDKGTLVVDLKTDKVFKDGTWVSYDENGDITKQATYAMEPHQ